MRKVIVYIATSADGFIARLDGSVDWLERPRPKGNYGMGVFYKSIDTILGNHKRDSSEHKPPYFVCIRFGLTSVPAITEEDSSTGCRRLLTDAGAAPLAPFSHRGSAPQCESGQRRYTPRREREP